MEPHDDRLDIVYEDKEDIGTDYPHIDPMVIVASHVIALMH